MSLCVSAIQAVLCVATRKVEVFLLPVLCTPFVVFSILVCILPSPLAVLTRWIFNYLSRINFNDYEYVCAQTPPQL